jgi:hypothetical protein
MHGWPDSIRRWSAVASGLTLAGWHDFQSLVKPFKDLAQGAVEQTFAEIKHGLDRRLRLLRQNHLY